MKLSVATSTFYFKSFNESLEIIKEAGFNSIELGIYFKGGGREMSQHMRNLSARDIIKMVDDYELEINSIHDGGGVLLDKNIAPNIVINPILDQYLNHMRYMPEIITFHPPHLKGRRDEVWWQRFSQGYKNILNRFSKLTTISLENLPQFEGYYSPLVEFLALRGFVNDSSLGITLDTSHSAEEGIDIFDALEFFNSRVINIHFSDYKNSTPHCFVGEGALNFSGFFQSLHEQKVKNCTLECSLSTSKKDQREMTHCELVNRLREAREYMEKEILKSLITSKACKYLNDQYHQNL